MRRLPAQEALTPGRFLTGSDHDEEFAHLGLKRFCMGAVENYRQYFVKGIWQSRKVETSRTRPHDKLTTDCTIFGGSTSQLPPHKSRHLQPTCYDLFLGTFLQ